MGLDISSTKNATPPNGALSSKSSVNLFQSHTDSIISEMSMMKNKVGNDVQNFKQVARRASKLKEASPCAIIASDGCRDFNKYKNGTDAVNDKIVEKITKFQKEWPALMTITLDSERKETIRSSVESIYNCILKYFEYTKKYNDKVQSLILWGEAQGAKTLSIQMARLLKKCFEGYATDVCAFKKYAKNTLRSMKRELMIVGTLEKPYDWLKGSKDMIPESCEFSIIELVDSISEFGKDLDISEINDKSIITPRNFNKKGKKQADDENGEVDTDTSVFANNQTKSGQNSKNKTANDNEKTKLKDREIAAANLTNLFNNGEEYIETTEEPIEEEVKAIVNRMGETDSRKMRNVLSFLSRVEKEKGAQAKLNNRTKRAITNKRDILTKANFTDGINHNSSALNESDF